MRGAKVTVLRGATAVASGTTNANGVYSVELPAGGYAVKVVSDGFAPSGQTLRLVDHDAAIDFQLEPLPSAEEGSDGDSSSGAGGGPSRGGDIPSLRPPRTVYIVEHRDNANATWVVLGTYPTEREAQAVLFRAVEHGQIAGAAPAESRIRAVRLSGSSPRKR